MKKMAIAAIPDSNADHFQMGVSCRAVFLKWTNDQSALDEVVRMLNKVYFRDKIRTEKTKRCVAQHGEDGDAKLAFQYQLFAGKV